MPALSHISAAVAGSLVASIWEGFLLAVIVALCLRLLPGITAAARSLVWLAVLLLVLALPFLQLTNSAASATTPVTALRLDERASLALVVLWAALSLWRSAELLRSALYLRAIRRRAQVIEVSADMAAILAAAPRHVELCASAEVDRPSVAGFFHPRILIPESLLETVTDAELTQILLHELGHLRRGDDWTNLLQKLALVAFPVNPVLLWVERRLCLERELACDDQVLKATQARKAYAACLANLAEHSLVRRGVSLALGAWERRPELVRRVHRILARPAREMSPRRSAMAVTVMIATLLAGADRLAHAPQLVTFGQMPVQVADAKASFLSVQAPAGLKPLSHSGASVQDVVFRPGRLSQNPKPATAPARLPGRSLLVRASAEARSLPASARAVAVKATMPERTSGITPRPQADEQTLVVMVTWHAVAPSNPAPEQDATDRAAMHNAGFSYAAVPTRDGWLIVKL